MGWAEASQWVPLVADCAPYAGVPSRLAPNICFPCRHCCSDTARSINPLPPSPATPLQARAEVNQELMAEYVVTRWYRAPELLLSCSDYGPPIDMWSGAIVFSCVCLLSHAMAAAAAVVLAPRPLHRHVVRCISFVKQRRTVLTLPCNGRSCCGVNACFSCRI